ARSRPVVAGSDAQDSDAPPAGWRRLLGTMGGPLVVDAAASFAMGGVNVLTVLIAVDVLRVGEAGTGFLQAATGVGGVVAGVAGGALLARRLRLPLVIGGAVGAIGLVWLAVSGDLMMAMVAIGVAIGGLLLLDVVNTTLIQRLVPDEQRGRAMGLLQTSSAIVYSLGSLLMPIGAAVLGVPFVLTASALIVVVGVGGGLLLSLAAPTPQRPEPGRLALLDRPIFAGLPAGRLEAAARRLVPVPVVTGETVVREGDTADRFYVIDTGTYRVTRSEDGREVVLRDLASGAVFGEIGLLRRIPRTATVTATSDGVVYALDADAFAELVGSGTGLSTRLLDLYRGALSR
ncbi:MAG: MFS transporter, partial [Chloroflexi bacterium]|nr:MFS transporter [Chloroflexota bacterium]